MEGTVKRLVRDRGFGFISTTDGREFFFHRSDVLTGGGFEGISEGDAVIFDEARSQKGPRAAQVRAA